MRILSIQSPKGLLEQVDTLTWVDIDNKTWDTIQDEGLDEEQDSSLWEMAELKIDDNWKEQLKNLTDEAIESFNAFDIELKSKYNNEIIDLIDYDNGNVTLVRVK